MALKDTVDIPIDLFGGLVLDMNPADLPPGASPNCPDMIFSETGPRTRPGIGNSIFTPIAGNPQVNYLKTYKTLNGTLRALVVDSSGSLWQENPAGHLQLVYGAFPQSQLPNSTTIFGREYIAVGDGIKGDYLPWQYDDVNFDRVSQVGPGAPPNAADDTATANVASITQPTAVNIASISEDGFEVTITTFAAHGLHFNDTFTVTGSGDPNYDGTWQVASVPSLTTVTYINGVNGLATFGAGGTTQSATSTVTTAIPHGFTVGQPVTIVGSPEIGYNGTWVIASVPTPTTLTFIASSAGLTSPAAGGTAMVGSILPGVHMVSVLFVTRQGYLTRPSPPASWTAAGLRRVVISNIPIGPANVVSRILCFTGAGGAAFFYIADPAVRMVILDNTTTTVTVDFSDTALFAGTNVDNLFNLIELGECSNVISYANRLFWVGMRTRINNFLNLSFDGGFSVSTGFPLGWTDGGQGGGSEDTNGVWLSAYRITGDGATASRGLITQSAYQDYLQQAIIQPGTGYSVRVRLAKGGGLVAGQVHVELYSVTLGGTVLAGVDVPASALTANFSEFTAALTVPGGIQVIPSDLLLRVYADGTPTAGGYFVIDCIEPYPTDQPVETSAARGSYASDPESYDGVTGLQNVTENDGQELRGLFTLRDNRLYYVKTGSLHATQDDQANEPNQWEIDTISTKVGTPSTRGVGVGGEDWVLIGSRNGLYIFWGPEPLKVSPEIQPLWDRINWAAGHTLWISVDPQERRIRVGVPLDDAVYPNNVLYLDYRDLDSASEIASSPPIHISYTGRKVAKDKARKWSPWSIVANHGTMIERFDGTQQFWLGNGTGNGKVYAQLDPYDMLGNLVNPANLNDDGVSVDGYYQTYYTPGVDQEQALQLKGHRKLYPYFTMFVEGTGTLRVTAVSPGGRYTYRLPNVLLMYPGYRDSELITNLQAERISYRIGMTGIVGGWFRLAKFVPTVQPDPFMPVRGF